jgi:hypothetical protein
MTLNLKDWTVKSVRISAFFNDDRPTKSLFTHLTSSEPEQTVFNKSIAQSMEAGHFQHGFLRIVSTAKRTDILFNFINKVELEIDSIDEVEITKAEFPSLGSFFELAPTIEMMLKKFVENVSGFDRFAIAFSLAIPYDERQPAYDTIKSLINFPLKISKHSDFVFQLNEKSFFGSVPVNCIFKMYTTLAKANYKIQSNGVDLTDLSYVSDPVYFLDLDLDLNTSPAITLGEVETDIDNLVMHLLKLAQTNAIRPYSSLFVDDGE